MRGLLVKDLRLILQQKRIWLMLIIMALFFTFAKSGMFGMLYMAMLAMLFSISTLSYDEYDNGYPFLMTLPFDRRTYVREKYLLCVMMSVGGCLAGSIINMLKPEEGTGLEEKLMETGVYLLAAILAAVVMLPLQLKFGAEQGRIYLFLTIAGLALAGGAFMQLFQMDASLSGALEVVSGPGGWGIVGCLAGAVVLLTLLSYCISVRVMEKKEF